MKISLFLQPRADEFFLRTKPALDLDGTEDVSSAGGGVGLSVPDTTTDDGSTNETSTTDGDTSESDGGQELGDLDGHLVRAVGEVVVTSGHEVESTGGLGALSTSVEEGRGHVEVVAVLEVLVVVVVVASSGGIGLAAASLTVSGTDARLIKVSQLEGKGRGEDFHLLDLARVVGAGLEGLGVQGYQVGAIVLVTSVTGLVGSVVVGTSPLEVDVISASDLEMGGSEIILNTRVALNDVSTTSTDTQVEDTCSRLDVSRALHDLEGMRTILEGTTELVGVDVQSQVTLLTSIVETEVHVGIVGHRGLILSIERSINHLSLLLIDMGETIVITRRNVVTDTESAGGILLILIEINVGDDPLVGLSHNGTADVDVTKMVITRLGRGEALRSSDTPALNLNPLVSIRLASSFVPVAGLVVPDIRNVQSLIPIHFEIRGSSNKADTLLGDVLGLRAVVAATVGVGSQHSNILPGGGNPVGVVIALLRALETIAVTVVSVGVLAGSLRRGIASQVLVGIEQSSVATTGTTSTIPGEGLLLTTNTSQKRILGIVGNTSISIIRTDRVGRSLLGTITDPGTTHVLQHEVAIHVVVILTTTVLRRPLNLQQ